MSGPEKTKDISSAYLIAYMEKHDLHLVVPKANELFIDLDDITAQDTFAQNYRKLSDVMNDLRFLSFHSAPSRRKAFGKHITITLSRNITTIERIALQAVLGSDLTRELYSVAQYFEGHLLPTVFLESKKKAEVNTDEVLDKTLDQIIDEITDYKPEENDLPQSE